MTEGRRLPRAWEENRARLDREIEIAQEIAAVARLLELAPSVNENLRARSEAWSLFREAIKGRVAVAVITTEALGIHAIERSTIPNWRELIGGDRSITIPTPKVPYLTPGYYALSRVAEVDIASVSQPGRIGVRMDRIGDFDGVYDYIDPAFGWIDLANLRALSHRDILPLQDFVYPEEL